MNKQFIQQNQNSQQAYLVNNHQNKKQNINNNKQQKPQNKEEQEEEPFEIIKHNSQLQDENEKFEIIKCNKKKNSLDDQEYEIIVSEKTQQEKILTKCKQLSEMLGGTPQQYQDICQNLGDGIPINELIQLILSERQKEEKQLQFLQQINKIYSKEIQEKAIIIGQVINKKPEQLYEVCKVYSKTENNEVVELLMQQPNLIEKYKTNIIV